MKVQEFYHEPTFTLTYIVYDVSTKDAIVIDPTIDYEPASSTYGFAPVKEIEDFIYKHNLKLHYILETHAHADHITGASELKNRFPDSKVAIGKHITKVQDVFKEIYNLKDMDTSGTQFDILLDENTKLNAGSIDIETIFTPGHTPACATYKINESIFTGDALFMPDFGTGRTDFPAGSANDLYESIKNKLYELPDNTEVYVGHDYKPGNRELKFKTTIAESKEFNIQLNKNTNKDEFINFREKRDATLNAPRLLLPSIQVNIQGGHFPKEEDNGSMYLKIPFRKSN